MYIVKTAVPLGGTRKSSSDMWLLWYRAKTDALTKVSMKLFPVHSVMRGTFGVTWIAKYTLFLIVDWTHSIDSR